MAVMAIDADVVMEATPVATSSAPAGPTAGAVKRVVARLLAGRDLATLSLKTLRKEVEERLGVPEGCLAARKDEVKTAAQAYMEQKKSEEAAAASGPAEQALVASRGASSRVVANGEESVGGSKRPAEDGQIVAPIKKVPKVTGNSLFRKEVWASVQDELTTQNGGNKPNLGTTMGAVAARFKALSKEELQKYEQQAEQANADALANGGPAPAKKQPGPKKDKAKPATKNKDGEPELTRAEFQKLSRTLKATLCTVNEDGSDGPELQQAMLPPRAFKTGTMGWFFCKKVAVPLGAGRSANCQMQLSFMVSNSKNWEDGEGYSPAALGGAATLAVDGAEAQSASGPTIAADCPAGAQEMTLIAPLVEATVEEAHAQTPTEATPSAPSAEAGPEEVGPNASAVPVESLPASETAAKGAGSDSSTAALEAAANTTAVPEDTVPELSSAAIEAAPTATTTAVPEENCSEVASAALEPAAIAQEVAKELPDLSSIKPAAEDEDPGLSSMPEEAEEAVDMD